MKKFSAVFILGLLSLNLVLISCSSPTSGDDASTISLSGLVVDGEENPIEDALVRIISPPPERITTTDSTGSYNFDLSIDSTTTYIVEARKEGLQVKTEEVLAVPERDVDLPNFVLTSSDTTGGDEEPDPSDSKGSAFISLENVSSKEIRVSGAGGTETSQLTFLVTDSAGVPVGHDNAVYVNFEILEGPQGTTLFPDSVLTENGLAIATIKSGIESGVVQVQASFQRTTNNGKQKITAKNHTGFAESKRNRGKQNTTNSTGYYSPNIQETITHKSQPVQLTIHGGLPTIDHFTLKSSVKNMAIASNEENTITVDLGDKYGNDVPVGTSVYFSTSHGTINGAADTDENGVATSNLQAGGIGSATITAETINANSETISKQIDVLFSGSPQISINPENISLENFTKQTFEYTVADENGNPLAPGTSISVTVDNDTLSYNGDTDITLSDHVEPGDGTTNFEFSLSNTDDAIITDDANLTITADGPNGTNSKSILLGSAEAPSMNPGQITLAENGVSNNEIGVINTGQTEQTEITFQVKDSTGRALDSDNQTEVRFSLGASPGGEEVIYPKTVMTDENGRATTTLTSGTKAGVVQVLAEITASDGTKITSKPVAITIHAGLPDQNHFTIARDTNKVIFDPDNNPQKMEFTVYAGDKHGNVVPDGTSIYFTTDGGYIEGAAQTVDGEASVNLTATNPYPPNGIATITAETANDAEKTISDQTTVAFVKTENATNNPGNITLADVTHDKIGVIGTGQTEQTKLTFQVTDSLGNILASDANAEVTFSFGASPGGGEGLEPSTVTTNADGQAATTLTSGTEAGIAQVVAEVTASDGTAITSQPVSVAIHAGLPDQSHFSIESSTNNVAAETGSQVTITTYVGDEYGNIVAEGTTVYFTTDGGYISGSDQTDQNGIATATLRAVKPTPADGTATVTATTANYQQSEISVSKDIIFSGAPSISVNPTTINMPNDANTTFTYTVEDGNGYPMASGTNINVNVEGNEIDTIGDVDITVGEPNDGFTNIPQLTDFQFNVRDAAGDTVASAPVQITITSSGPNGTARTTISGSKAKAK